MSRRSTKIDKATSYQLRTTLFGQVAIVSAFSVLLLAAPWPGTVHDVTTEQGNGFLAYLFERLGFLFWREKLSLWAALVALSFIAARYFRKRGWRARSFVWWRSSYYFLWSLIPLSAALLCALVGFQSFLLGAALICGWCIVFSFFFYPRLKEWNSYYQEILQYGKLESKSGAFNISCPFPAFRGNQERVLHPLVGFLGAALLPVIAISSILGTEMFRTFGGNPEAMNGIWLGLNYLLAVLLAPMPAIYIFDIMAVDRWEKEHGRSSHIRFMEHNINAFRQ